MPSALPNANCSVTVFQDKKSVESTCLCFARLVDNFQHEEVCCSNQFFYCWAWLDVSGITISIYLLCCPIPVDIYVCSSTEPSAGGCVTRPLDQYSAVAGSDSSSAQLGNVHYGCTHVFPYVL